MTSKNKNKWQTAILRTVWVRSVWESKQQDRECARSPSPAGLIHARCSGSAGTSAISLGKLRTNKLTDKCPGSQMTALWKVWKHFAKLHPHPRARHTGRLSAMGVVKWDRCWGLKRPQWESETDASAARLRQLRDENMGGPGGGGSLFTTPDLPWNTFCLTGDNRVGALTFLRTESGSRVGKTLRIRASEFSHFPKVWRETTRCGPRPPLGSPIAAASLFRKGGNSKVQKNKAKV